MVRLHASHRLATLAAVLSATMAAVPRAVRSPTSIAAAWLLVSAAT